MNNPFYLVDPNVVLITGEYDPYGKLCARVMIGRKTILVNQSPLQLLDSTLKYISFTLKGALAGAKNILGNQYMCPIIVNPFQGICLFPIRSPKKEDCIWFNPDHIVKTKAKGSKTVVNLSNGLSMIVDLKLHTFNSKMQTAIQLKRIVCERGTQAFSVSELPSQNHIELKTNAATGKYNFDSLAE
ncbi:competence protein ComK [Bacillus sp. USDA818B3_A]|uniref:competence protein ComK n=1 Tax=Bacillus sp. USDA818B3_A TaxID=2698834 RepID=UPI00136F0B07|nr:competence protein ComK [Bacillus sp. USDA818B3_A]